LEAILATDDFQPETLGDDDELQFPGLKTRRLLSQAQLGLDPTLRDGNFYTTPDDPGIQAMKGFSWSHVYEGMQSITITGDITKYIEGMTSETGGKKFFHIGTKDPNFDGLGYLREKYAGTEDEQMIEQLIEVGQFDTVYNPLDADQYAQEGLDTIKALQNIDTTGEYGAMIGGGILAGLAESYVLAKASFGVGGLLRLGKLAKQLKTVGRARTAIKLLDHAKDIKALRAAGNAARIGAYGVAWDKSLDTLSPSTDLPGVQDELMVFGLGSFLGGGLPLLAKGARGGLRRVTGAGDARAKIDRHMKGLKISREEVMSLQSSASRNRTMGADSKWSVADEQTRNLEELRQIADGPLADNTPVRALIDPANPADPSLLMLERIKKRYAAAGKTLHVTEHDDQSLLSLLSYFETDAGFLDLSRVATRGELDVSKFGKLLSAHTKIGPKFTPGGRLETKLDAKDTTLRLLQDVFVLASGSSSTLKAGSALNPLANKAGATIEGLKTQLDNKATQLMAGNYTAFKAARAARKKGDRINFDGRELQLNRIGGKVEFENAVVELLRRRHAAKSGFDVSIPKDVHPSIEAAADATQSYFDFMGQKLVEVGFLDPSNANLGNYMPVVFSPRLVRANPQEFVDRLAQAMLKKDLVRNGVKITADDVILDPKVVEEMNRKAGKDVFEGYGKGHETAKPEDNRGLFGAKRDEPPTLPSERVPLDTAGERATREALESLEDALRQAENGVPLPRGADYVDPHRPVELGGNFPGQPVKIAGHGPRTTLYDPAGGVHDGQVILVDLDDLLPSHDPTGARNAKGGFAETKGRVEADGSVTPPDRNVGRGYGDPREGQQSIDTVQRIGQDPKPELVQNVPSTFQEGMPAIAKTGAVVSGNARTQGMKLAYQQGNADQLRAFTLKKAKELGIATENVPNKPVLVVALENPGKPGELSRIANESMSAAYSGRGNAVARAESLSQDTIDLLSSRLLADDGDVLTLAKVLEDPKNADDILRALEKDRVFTARDVQEIFDVKRKKLTPEGRTKIQTTLLARVLDQNMDVLADAAPGVENKVMGIIPELLRVEKATNNTWHGHFTLAQRMPEFVEAHTAWKGSGETWEDFFFNQVRMTPDAKFIGDGKASIMAYALDTMGPRAFRDAMKKYLDDVSPGRILRPGEESVFPMTPVSNSDTAFMQAFAAGLDSPTLTRHMESNEIGGYLKGNLVGHNSNDVAFVRQLALERQDEVLQDLADAGRVTVDDLQSTTDAGGVRFSNMFGPSPRNNVEYTFPEGTDIGPALKGIRDRVKGIDREGLSKEDLDTLELLEKGLRVLGDQNNFKPGSKLTLDSSDTAPEIFSRTKGETRIQQIMDSGADLRTISDILGYQFKVNSFQHAQETFRNLQAKGYRLLELDNSLEMPRANLGGHRMIRAFMRTPDGKMTVEIQGNIPEFRDINGLTHKPYELSRLHKDNYETGGTKIGGVTLVTKDEAKLLNARLKEVFDEAFARFEARGGAQSSLDIPTSPRGMPRASTLPGDKAPSSIDSTVRPSTDLRDQVRSDGSQPSTNIVSPGPSISLSTPSPVTSAAARMRGSIGGPPNRNIPTAERFANTKVGDLEDNLRFAYEDERRIQARRAAEGIKNGITGSGRGNVAGRGTGNEFAERVLNIDYSEVGDFLDSTVESLVSRYSFNVHGRAATARALQLNRDVWEQYRLDDGSPIKTYEDLVTLQTQHFDKLKQLANATGNQKLMKAADSGATRAERDIIRPLAEMNGDASLSRNSVNSDSVLGYLGRNVSRVNFLNKLGSVGWAQLNDITPITLHMLNNPKATKNLVNAIGLMKEMPKRDLEFLGLWADMTSRARKITDADFDVLDEGIGMGGFRRATAGAESFLQDMSDFSAKASGMNWITNSNKRLGTLLTFDELGRTSKRMIQAQDLINEGLDPAAAFRKAKLSKFRAAKTNQAGFNYEAAKRYHRLVYENGYTSGGKKISDMYSGPGGFAKYMKDQKTTFLPGFDDWNLEIQANRDLLDVITSRVDDEVNRHLVVTPGQFDKPLINYTIMGKLFNQFQTFTMAFVNQRSIPMAQMPARYQLWYQMSYLFMGALTDSITNHLSGRRTFDESIEQWGENPLGMTYKAWSYSGMGGPITRLTGITDYMGVPISPGVAFGNTVGGGATQPTYSGQAEKAVVQAMGPTGSMAADVVEVSADVLKGEADEYTAYNAARLLPFQNNAILRLLYRTTGAPVVPEAILDDE